MEPSRFVPVLDLIAFFLITPEILGKERIRTFNKFLASRLVLSPLYAAKARVCLALGFEISDEDENNINIFGMIIYSIISVTLWGLISAYLHVSLAAFDHIGKDIFQDNIFPILRMFAILLLLPVVIYMALKIFGGFFGFMCRRSVVVILAIFLFVSARVIEIDARWNFHWFDIVQTAALAHHEK